MIKRKDVLNKLIENYNSTDDLSGEDCQNKILNGLDSIWELLQMNESYGGSGNIHKNGMSWTPIDIGYLSGRQFKTYQSAIIGIAIGDYSKAYLELYNFIENYKLNIDEPINNIEMWLINHIITGIRSGIASRKINTHSL